MPHKTSALEIRLQELERRLVEVEATLDRTLLEDLGTLIHYNKNLTKRLDVEAGFDTSIAKKIPEMYEIVEPDAVSASENGCNELLELLEAYECGSERRELHDFSLATTTFADESLSLLTDVSELSDSKYLTTENFEELSSRFVSVEDFDEIVSRLTFVNLKLMRVQFGLCQICGIAGVVWDRFWEARPAGAMDFLNHFKLTPLPEMNAW